jgi:4-diphosphocytidyl-2-C-methyl-D-erythritol kinase
VTELRVAAPAKLNLYLHVTGKRADGYHLLDGLVAFADVHDALTIAPAPSLAFSADGPFAAGLGDSDGNLVVRAALALGAAVGREPGLRLHLTKRLPVASGIGGGSADAAACLRGLAMLWDLDPAGEAVMDVAHALGADIPVCVAGRAAYIGGIGTEIDPAPSLPGIGLLLVNPGIALPTPDVYRARQGAFTPPMRLDRTPRTAKALAAELALRRNDLTAAAISCVPEIERVLATIAGTEGCLLARMSGSGATCFGLYGEPAEAGRVATLLRRDHPHWWMAAGCLLDNVSAFPAAL